MEELFLTALMFSPIVILYLLIGRGENFNTSDPHAKHLNIDVEMDRAERELNKDERLK